jgi:hypothetical protein
LGVEPLSPLSRLLPPPFLAQDTRTTSSPSFGTRNVPSSSVGGQLMKVKGLVLALLLLLLEKKVVTTHIQLCAAPLMIFGVRDGGVGVASITR